jgi:hypothetical protein
MSAGNRPMCICGFARLVAIAKPDVVMRSHWNHIEHGHTFSETLPIYVGMDHQDYTISAINRTHHQTLILTSGCII